MKLNFKSAMIMTALGTGLLMGFQNCGRLQSAQTVDSSSSATPAAAGNGAMFAGVGSSSVPTAEGVVARLTNGLQGNVSPSAGNFAKALNAVKGNLPRTTDPSRASGFDQVQLLVYAACSDLTTGGANSKMAKSYNVPTTGTPTANRAALIAAGMKMFDTYVAGLGSQGPTADKVTAAFDKLVSDVAGTASNTTTIAFVSVCIAANTAGTTLMGF
jgi:hypothetical protein